LGFQGRLARLDAAALALPAAVFVDRLMPPTAPNPPETIAPEPVAAEPVVPIEDAARLSATPDAVESGTPLRAGERPAVGRWMGKCLLTELVGRGGSAMVFRALHTTLRIPVAVKVLLLDQIERDRRVLDLLGEEAALLARLNHPNIVRVLDFEGDATYPYLVLEFVEGLSLADLISQSGRLRPDRAVGVMRQVCAGLAEARRLGVVHRDIKPANILVARDGAAKIVDLGLAVIVGAGPSNKSSSAAGLDVLAGTVAYMAPEQSLGGTDLDHRCDIYSLGATFYHAVTGQVPFRGRTMLEVMRKHAQEPVPLAHLAAPDVPPGFSEVIARMMAKQPTERYADYAELDAALAGLVGKPPAERPAAGDRPAGVSGGEPSLSGSRRSWRSLLGSLFRRPGEAFSDPSGASQTGASQTGGTQAGGTQTGGTQTGGTQTGGTGTGGSRP
jgi:serine/threonine protein kinase